MLKLAQLNIMQERVKMKIDLKLNGWFVLWFMVIGIILIIGLIIAVNNAQEYYTYQKYISDNQKGVIDWYYNCDSNFESKWYNCPQNESYKNLSGQYCYGKLICENKYKIKEARQ